MNMNSINEPRTVTEVSARNCFNCISWSAIFVGAVVAVGLSFIISLFTTGLGLSAFTTSSEGLLTLAVGGFIWLFIASYISMFVAGWIAGALAPSPIYKCSVGVLHGFAAWCVALIIASLIALHSGNLVAATDSAQFYDRTAPSVQTTNNDAMPAVSAKNTNSGNPQVVVNPEKAVRGVGFGLLATFFIFLIGAVGSCVGGYLGARACRRDRDQLPH